MKKLYRKDRWLKHYMGRSHLEKALTSSSIFFGDYENWPDKNDQATLRIFEENTNSKIRVRCFNQGPERQHFWSGYSSESDPTICLWYDKDRLIQFLDDQKIQHANVQYLTANQLRNEGKKSKIPFYKRTSYGDENEYRAICFDNTKLNNNALVVPKDVLARVYLGPQLLTSESKKLKQEYQSLADGLGYNLKVLQNLSRSSTQWQSAAQNIS